MDLCQSNLPSRREKHMSVRKLFFSMAWVTNTLSPQTAGVELPRSGRGTFHFTFSVALHRVGRFLSGVMPSPSAPRQAGQLAAPEERTNTIPQARCKATGFMRGRIM